MDLYNLLWYRSGGKVTDAEKAAWNKAVRDLTNLEYAANDSIFRVDILEGSDRSRTLSSGAMPLGRVNSVGGYSYVPEGEQEIISASPAQIISQDADAETLFTSDLSALVAQYFPDGMHSAGTVHDELDLENKKAIKRIAAVDLGTLNYNHNGTQGEQTLFVTLAEYLTDRAYTTNCICGRFQIAQYGTPWNMMPRTDSGRIEFSVPTAEISTAANFKAAMDGVILYYELAEPVVTDITEDVENLVNLPLAPEGTITVTTSLDAEGITVGVPSKIVTYTKLEVQPKLTPGFGITIAENGTISVSLPDGDEVSY